MPNLRHWLRCVTGFALTPGGGRSNAARPRGGLKLPKTKTNRAEREAVTSAGAVRSALAVVVVNYDRFRRQYPGASGRREVKLLQFSLTSQLRILGICVKMSRLQVGSPRFLRIPGAAAFRLMVLGQGLVFAVWGG